MPGLEVIPICQSLHFAQVLMDELHRHRSFADTGSYAFYRTMAHITNGKNAGSIGLEQERISVECPSLRTFPIAYKIRAGQQETALVPLDHIGQPIRARQCPDKDEHRTRRHTLNLIGIGTKNRYLLQ